MSGRRRHSRFGLASEGVLRMLRDVEVRAGDDGELIVVSREPAIAGDVMSIERMDGYITLVEVVESRLVMHNGFVGYEARLRRISKSRRARRHTPAFDVEKR
jgi:hypothetical protein